MGKKFKDWVISHSINGPSSIELENENKKRLVLLFCMEESNLWFVVSEEDTKKEIKTYKGEYYLVFRDELNRYLNKN